MDEGTKKMLAATLMTVDVKYLQVPEQFVDRHCDAQWIVRSTPDAVQSDHNAPPDVEIVSSERGGYISCSCRDWMHNHRWCKHVKHLIAYRDEESCGRKIDPNTYL